MRSMILLSLVSAAALAASPEPDCANPVTTYDMNACGSREAQSANAELQRYLDAAAARLQKEEPQALKALQESQAAWVRFKDKHCGAISARWQGGTVRGPATVQCALDLTRQRTHQLWAGFLTYADRTPPILPEPRGAAR